MKKYSYYNWIGVFFAANITCSLLWAQQPQIQLPSQPISQPPAQVPTPHPITQALEACLEQNLSTLGMVECNTQAEKKWDAALNVTYQNLMNQLDARGKAALKKSQLQWLKFRDEEFQAIGSMYGRQEGTIWRINTSEAMMEIVKSRVLVLQRYVDILMPQEQ